jgi:hypothetical protein
MVALIGIFSGLLCGYAMSEEFSQLRSQVAAATRSGSTFLLDPTLILECIRIGLNLLAAAAVVIGGALVLFKVRMGRVAIFAGAGWLTFLAIQSVLLYSHFRMGARWERTTDEGIYLPIGSAVYLILTSIILTRPTLFRAA